MRRRILLAFEKAEETQDPERRRSLLTFVIVGAGPTGVELAGALAEIARRTLRDDFRTIDPGEARILLVEAGPRVLATYPEGLSEKARAQLASLGVDVRLGAAVTDVRDGEVDVAGAGGRRDDPRRRPSSGPPALPRRRSGHRSRAPRARRSTAPGVCRVAPDLTLPGHPEVFVIGDLMTLADAKGRPLPGVAPVAMQQGRHVARPSSRASRRGPDRVPSGTSTRAAWRRSAAAAPSPTWASCASRVTPAWLAWLFIHLMYLVQFGNRVLILVQWAWSYLTWNRSARLITERRP